MSMDTYHKIGTLTLDELFDGSISERDMTIAKDQTSRLVIPFTQFQTSDGSNHYGISGFIKREIGDILVVEFTDDELGDFNIINPLFESDSLPFPKQQFVGLNFRYEVETGDYYIRPRTEEELKEMHENIRAILSESDSNESRILRSGNITLLGNFHAYELKQPSDK